jgi:hypothetical protein
LLRKLLPAHNSFCVVEQVLLNRVQRWGLIGRSLADT